MGIRDRKMFAVPIVTVLLLVVGCSSPDPQVIDESKYEDLYDHQRESDDDVDSDEADESDGDETDGEAPPEPPKLPDEVKDPSEDGAMAAVEYFFDAYEYSLNTLDLEPIKKGFSKDCAYCDNLEREITEINASGKSSDNSGFSELDVKSTLQKDGLTEILIEINIGETTFYDDETLDKSYEYDDLEVLMKMKYEESAWKLKSAHFAIVGE